MKPTTKESFFPLNVNLLSKVNKNRSRIEKWVRTSSTSLKYEVKKPCYNELFFCGFCSNERKINSNFRFGMFMTEISIESIKSRKTFSREFTWDSAEFKAFSFHQLLLQLNSQTSNLDTVSFNWVCKEELRIFCWRQLNCFSTAYETEMNYCWRVLDDRYQHCEVTQKV